MYVYFCYLCNYMDYIVKTNIKRFALLKLYVNKNDPDLVKVYKEHIDKHNRSIQTDPFPNSGFDVFFPKEKLFDIELYTTMVSMDIKTEMVYYDNTSEYQEPSAFYVFPRSSMSKTPLMLSNHTGIIDCGYRGWLLAAFRWLNNIPVRVNDLTNEYIVEKHARLLQICHPSLCPIVVELVESEEELSKTIRDDGAFGSTGKIGAT